MSSNCSNCYNGCAETVSDQCVRYTGEDIPALGISHGDSLLAVENAITTFLVPVLTGVGVKPVISESIICNVVKKFLPPCTQCTGFTLNEVLTAIIKAACSLQEQIDDLVTEFGILNANYDVDCLSGVVSSSGTHDILQAAINKICELEVNLGALAIDLATNYYTKTQVDTLLSTYTPPGANLVKSKMIPYVALPFFSTDLSMFDAGGAGMNDWVDIYLCNGSSHPGAPDLRGRVLVGVTTNVPGGPMDPAVIPNMGTGGFNPSYTIGSVYGSNSIQLGIPEIPSHSHTITNTVIINDPGHFHYLDNAVKWNGSIDRPAGSYTRQDYLPQTQPEVTGLKGTGPGQNVFVNSIAATEGNNQPHSNIQPVIACNYIIYIP
jgi:microcystin-dependent protein